MQERLRFLPLLAALLFVFISAPLSVAKEGSAKKAGSAKQAGSATQAGSACKVGLDGTVSLFNGKNLDNWVQRGGTAEYTIEGDMIVGTSKLDTPNSFLCTPRDYTDFVLELDFKVDDGLNSGIQIRSNERTKAEKDTGRVYGYQVEIDPSERSWSAGIYDESRRGWLNDLKDNQPAREAFKHNDWNHYRIEAIGDSIKTWINGVPAADLKDDMTAKGFIALQVHSIHDETLVGKQVRWKNIVIREMTK